MILANIFFSAVLLIFAIVDIRSRLIPNKLLLVAGIATLFILGRNSIEVFVLGIIGGLTGFAFYSIFYLLIPGKVGAGDVKLAGLIGLMTGIPLVFLALPLGILMAGVVVMIMMAFKRIKITGSIPYAPFLCSGAIISLWVGDWFISWYLGLF